MTQVLLTNAQVIINSVDLSNRIDSVAINEVFADVDTTTFGSPAKTRIAGLGDHKVIIEFQQDFAAASVAATIDPLVGLTAACSVKPVAGTTTTTNPAYTFTVVITDWRPVEGKVGEIAKANVTWPITGTITKATS
jgi:hypothetical protein